MIEIDDSSFLYGRYTLILELDKDWTDWHRAYAINLKAKTAEQTMELATTGKLASQ